MSCAARHASAEGFVLAGGRSTRMGSDKARLELEGTALVARALATLRAAGLTARIAGGAPELASFAPVVPDERPGRGPLSGICAALQATQAELAIFLPVDMPLLPAAVIRALVERARGGDTVTAVSLGGAVQTFPVALRRDVLPRLEVALNSGDTRCGKAFAEAADGASATVAAEGLAGGVQGQAAGCAPVEWFLNTNRPEELAHAQVLLSRAHRVS